MPFSTAGSGDPVVHVINGLDEDLVVHLFHKDGTNETAILKKGFTTYFTLKKEGVWDFIIASKDHPDQSKHGAYKFRKNRNYEWKIVGSP